MSNTTVLTQERLKNLLHYEPRTGVFSWKVARQHRRLGDEAGSIHAHNGYRYIGIDGRKYYVQRLAWLYMTGEWPVNQVDHADLNKVNNAWSNLRAANHAENMRNRRVNRNTRSGFKGVHYAQASAKKWAANIMIDGVLKRLGYFVHPEEAHAAYAKAAEAAFGQFARS